MWTAEGFCAEHGDRARSAQPRIPSLRCLLRVLGAAQSTLRALCAATRSPAGGLLLESSGRPLPRSYRPSGSRRCAPVLPSSAMPGESGELASSTALPSASLSAGGGKPHPAVAQQLSPLTPGSKDHPIMAYSPMSVSGVRQEESPRLRSSAAALPSDTAVWPPVPPAATSSRGSSPRTRSLTRSPSATSQQLLGSLVPAAEPRAPRRSDAGLPLPDELRRPSASFTAGSQPTGLHVSHRARRPLAFDGGPEQPPEQPGGRPEAQAVTPPFEGLDVERQVRRCAPLRPFGSLQRLRTYC
jgi:hypothetical protein